MTHTLRLLAALTLASAPLTAAAQVASQPASQPTTQIAARRAEVRKALESALADTTRRKTEQMRSGAIKFLIAAQDKDGAWAADTGPGITALVVTALAGEKEAGPKHPAVQRGAAWVFRSQRPDGGIYSGEGLLKNYETSVALMMLVALGDPAHQSAIAAAQKFLKDNQWDESEGRSVDDPFYGGAGYGQGERPDLSNTQMMLEALHASGVPADDPVYRKALVFIQRCQMLGEHNDQPFAKGSTDGGFIYSPAKGGESKAGEWEVRGGRKELRSYGSMTYAAFKSMLYCGLKRDDPRVRAAVDWITRYWTLDFNPNMPADRCRQGLYYYYHVFARALAAWGEEVIRDEAGRDHYWRKELVDELARQQRPDGSWVNEQDRWMEGKPELVTAYALLALQAAYPADSK